MYTILKHFKTTTDNSMIYVDESTNRIRFDVKLPLNAVVDTVKVGGKFIEDLGTPVIFNAHRKLVDDLTTFGAAATAYFPEGIPDELHDNLVNYVIQEFEVFYHEEAVTEV